MDSTATNERMAGLSRSNSTAELILDTALKQFSTVGYHGTSMRELANLVGVMPASLYNHFSSKEELLWKLMQAAIDELNRLQDEARPTSKDPRIRLRTFVSVHAWFHAEHRELALVVNGEMSSLDKAHLKRTISFRDRYTNELMTCIQDGVDEGIFRVLDVRVTSYAILQMGMGISTWYRPEGPVTVDELCRLHEELAMRMVGAGT